MGGDEKYRKQVLLTDCADHDPICTFAFASTSGFEAAFLATYHLLDPYKTSYRGTGFDAATYVYASRLVAVCQEDVGDKVGRLMDDMPAVRDRLRVALGIGTGTANGAGPAAGSYRGQVVELATHVVEETGIRFAVVITEPFYSRSRRYQTVIPTLDATEFAFGEDCIVVEGETWQNRIAIEKACLAVPLVHSYFQPTDFRGQTGVVVSEVTMAEIDRYLMLRFNL